MKLFEFKGVPTTDVMVDYKNGRIAILPVTQRGGPATQGSRGSRTARNFTLLNHTYEDTILANDVQDVRKFGSENQLEGIGEVVTDRLAEMQKSHDATAEWHRANAIKGLVKDADGTDLLDLFTEFGITETSEAFDFATAGAAKVSAFLVKRTIARALGETPFTGVVAVCSPGWFDVMTVAADVKEAYDRWQNGEFLRADNREGFEYAGIRWMEYDAQVGGTDFVTADTCRFFPTGVPGLFKEFFGPADFMEAVNTIGKRYYAKQERLPLDRGVLLHTQSNPLMVCTQPAVLIEGTLA